MSYNTARIEETTRPEHQIIFLLDCLDIVTSQVVAFFRWNRFLFLGSGRFIASTLRGAGPAGAPGTDVPPVICGQAEVPGEGLGERW